MKKIIVLVLMCCVLFTLSSCGDESNKDSDKIKLSFIRVGNDAPERDFWKDIIEAFELEYPEYSIEYDDAPIGEDMDKKLNAAFLGGKGYDIVGVGIISVADRVEMGHFQPITSYFNSWSGKDDYMESVLSNGFYKGEQYGLAYATTPYVFAYRTDLLSEEGYDTPPKTWDELVQYARSLTKLDDRGNITTSGFAFPSTAGNHVEFDILCYGNGGGFIDGDGNPTLTNEKNIEALEFLKSFIREVTVSFSSNETNPFLNGNAAMTFINNVNLKPMWENESYKDKVAIAVPPNNGVEANFCGCNMLFIGSKTEYPDECFKFIEFALSPENSLKRAEVLSMPVVRKSLVEQFSTLDKYNDVRAKCVEIGTGMPRATWSSTFQRERNLAVQSIMNADGNPEQVLNDAQQNLLDYISQNP